MKKIILITGSELRHEYFRKFISLQNGVNVIATFCESKIGSIEQIVKEQDFNNLRRDHLSNRLTSEIEFFNEFCNVSLDKSNPIFIEKGEINNQVIVDKIVELDPEIIISYGCSIIKSNILLEKFYKKFINIHLGLSPYYRGSGTNFWPFVNNELQFVGTTFMFIDKGIDTGEIIHQIRADFDINDSIHSVGNKLLLKTFKICYDIIANFSLIENHKVYSNINNKNFSNRYYKKSDFTENSVEKAYYNIENGIIKNYIENNHELYPIIKNSIIKNL